MTAWIKPTSFAQTWQPIFYKGQGDYPHRTYTVFLNSAGFLLLSSQDVGAERTLVTANGSIPLNRWTHIAIVMDRTNGGAAIYLNGQLAASANAQAFPVIDASDSLNQPLYLGFSPESSLFRYTGFIDDAAVFGTALSASAVGSIYQASRGTFNVDLLDSSNAVVQSIATNVHGSSFPNWTIPASLTPGTYRVRVSSSNSASTFGLSLPLMIVPSGHDYYVNDASLTGDQTDTAIGNNANDGKTANTPMASIEAVINTYHPGVGDTIHVENGTYTLFHNICSTTSIFSPVTPA
jgi:hypothetical protein